MILLKWFPRFSMDNWHSSRTQLKQWWMSSNVLGFLTTLPNKRNSACTLFPWLLFIIVRYNNRNSGQYQPERCEFFSGVAVRANKTGNKTVIAANVGPFGIGVKRSRAPRRIEHRELSSFSSLSAPVRPARCPAQPVTVCLCCFKLAAARSRAEKESRENGEGDNLACWKVDKWGRLLLFPGGNNYRYSDS